ncbi:hypothetical protein ABZ896_39250 [Streptomyces sp. NPDC047072]|uniref:hypothetical protein n=1 Tax=Streptomyces sp. NPDC047072 TaxID=3154809 RepID=UPI0033DD046A
MRTSSWAWFCAWLLVGALASLGLLTVLSIGVFLLPAALVAAVLLATRNGSRVGLAGLLSGLGAPLLYVAFLNREGPGNVCTTSASGQSCVDEYSPWGWLAAGVVLLLAGIALGVLLRRGAPRH